jgi:hypothetical protein
MVASITNVYWQQSTARSRAADNGCGASCGVFFPSREPSARIVATELVDVVGVSAVQGGRAVIGCCVEGTAGGGCTWLLGLSGHG